MEILMSISGMLPVILLILIGWLIKYKKAYWLISGYNPMSAEKKKNVDIEGLGRCASNLCFVIAAIIFSAFMLVIFKKTTAAAIVFALLLPTIIYTLINIQKYDGNNRSLDGRMKTSSKVIIGSTISFIVLTAVGVCILLYYSNKPAEYSIQNGSLNISGIFGQKVPTNEIISLELKENIPKVLYKSNGSAIGNMLKGDFKLKDIGNAKLFVDVSKPPFIYIKSNYKTIIINCDDSNKTKELYQKLSQKWELEKTNK